MSHSSYYLTPVQIYFNILFYVLYNIYYSSDIFSYNLRFYIYCFYSPFFFVNSKTIKETELLSQTSDFLIFLCLQRSNV